jgi:hypothetical protein
VDDNTMKNQGWLLSVFIPGAFFLFTFTPAGCQAGNSVALPRREWG